MSIAVIRFMADILFQLHLLSTYEKGRLKTEYRLRWTGYLSPIGGQKRRVDWTLTRRSERVADTAALKFALARTMPHQKMNPIKKRGQARAFFGS
jgi:hypothetical protein